MRSRYVLLASIGIGLLSACAAPVRPDRPGTAVERVVAGCITRGEIIDDEVRIGVALTSTCAGPMRCTAGYAFYCGQREKWTKGTCKCTIKAGEKGACTIKNTCDWEYEWRLETLRCVP